MLTDIHHHLIYLVDDGPDSEEKARQMLLRAAAEGVGDIVCTSHAVPGVVEFPTEAYLRRIGKLQRWSDAQGLRIRLHTGCEMLWNDMLVAAVQRGEYPTLAQTWCVLVEFQPDVSLECLCTAARSLGNAGYTVIFAHVERYQVLRNLRHVRMLRDDYGVYMQVNASTVLARRGILSGWWMKRMLDEDLVDLVASDAHNTGMRPCRLGACYEQLCTLVGQERAEELCGGLQRRLLGL